MLVPAQIRGERSCEYKLLRLARITSLYLGLRVRLPSLIVPLLASSFLLRSVNLLSEIQSPLPRETIC